LTVGKVPTSGYLSQVKRPEIYRRRRLGALLATLLTAYLLGAGTGSADPAPVSHTVEPGDTLWSIATEHYPPSEDPRATVEAIRRENDLEGYGIRPGMRLELPG
jgi:nucleoid-associated protein YgaU